jgi:hypothetical protein
MSFQLPNPQCAVCKGEGIHYVKQASRFFRGRMARVGMICDCMRMAVKSADLAAVAKVAQKGGELLNDFARELQSGGAA